MTPRLRAVANGLASKSAINQAEMESVIKDSRIMSEYDAQWITLIVPACIVPYPLEVEELN
jgi:hypothetical protein